MHACEMRVMRAAKVEGGGQAVFKAAIVINMNEYRFQHCKFLCNFDLLVQTIDSLRRMSLTNDKELLD